MNILKDSVTLSTYQKMARRLKFDDAWTSLASGIASHRFFSIVREGDNLLLKPLRKYEQLISISKLLPYVGMVDKSLLLSLGREHKYNIRDKKSILTMLHIDLILAIKYWGESRSAVLGEYLLEQTGNPHIIRQVSAIYQIGYRSNIYTTNKDSVIVDMLTPALSQNIKKLSKANLALLTDNPLLAFVEISREFDDDKITEFLILLSKLSEKIIKSRLVEDKMRFSLKLRKIKRTNKKGMFIVAQNTIVLDPRHTDSLTHEVGHWYHTWFRKEIEGADAERFANDFKDYL